MRWLSALLYFGAALIIFIIATCDNVQSISVSENIFIDNSRAEGSCMISRNNFNRSCIYHKIVYLVQKIPLMSRWPALAAPVGSLELIKLPDYATNTMSVTDERPKSRSFVTNFVSLVTKTMDYFLDSYGIKISIPTLSKNFPGIVVEEYSTNETDPFDESRHKKKRKKFALVFPLIAIFKFIIIKALLIPILLGIIAIKKMLVLAAAAIPAVIAVLRICRFPGGGIFGGLTAATAAAAPLVGTPYVTSDTIIGDFSNYAPAALAAQQTPYYNKQQDYGGKSLSTFNQLTNF